MSVAWSDFAAELFLNCCNQLFFILQVKGEKILVICCLQQTVFMIITVISNKELCVMHNSDCKYCIF